jgi:hypothetical protein
MGGLWIKPYLLVNYLGDGVPPQPEHRADHPVPDGLSLGYAEHVNTNLQLWWAA